MTRGKSSIEWLVEHSGSRDHLPFEAPATAGERRVLRGGAYYRTTLRSAERGAEGADFAYQGVGVRAVRGLDP